MPLLSGPVPVEILEAENPLKMMTEKVKAKHPGFRVLEGIAVLGCLVLDTSAWVYLRQRGLGFLQLRVLAIALYGVNCDRVYQSFFACSRTVSGVFCPGSSVVVQICNALLENVLPAASQDPALNFIGVKRVTDALGVQQVGTSVPIFTPRHTMDVRGLFTLSVVSLTQPLKHVLSRVETVVVNALNTCTYQKHLARWSATARGIQGSEDDLPMLSCFAILAKSSRFTIPAPLDQHHADPGSGIRSQMGALLLWNLLISRNYRHLRDFSSFEIPLSNASTQDPNTAALRAFSDVSFTRPRYCRRQCANLRWGHQQEKYVFDHIADAGHKSVGRLVPKSFKGGIEDFFTSTNVRFATATGMPFVARPGELPKGRS